MPGKQWTSGERQKLADHYSYISAANLSKLLGRTPAAIERRAFKDDLKKDHERLREMGRENVARRKDRQCAIFVEPPSPEA